MLILHFCEFLLLIYYFMEVNKHNTQNADSCTFHKSSLIYSIKRGTDLVPIKYCSFITEWPSYYLHYFTPNTHTGFDFLSKYL